MAKAKKFEILGEAFVEYVKQYKTDDGQLFDKKSDAIGHATELAIVQKIKKFLQYHENNDTSLISDNSLTQLIELGQAADVVKAFRENKKETVS